MALWAGSKGKAVNEPRPTKLILDWFLARTLTTSATKNPRLPARHLTQSAFMAGLSPGSENSPGRRRIWRILTAAVAVCAASVLVEIAVQWNRPDPEQLLRQARLELAREHFSEAEQLALQVGETSGASQWAWIVAAEAAVRQDRQSDALRYYLRVQANEGELSCNAGFGAAEMLCHLGRLSESEQWLRKVLAVDPGHTLSHQRLAFILNITGRRWEATSHLLHVVQQKPGDIEAILLLGSSERMVDDRVLLEHCLQAAPDDPLPLLGEARRHLALNEVTEATRLLERIRVSISAEPEVQVRLGQLLLDANNDEPFLKWHQALPAVMDSHPDLWMVRGRFALQRGEQEVAARCFWEAMQRDPEHRSAHYRLGQVLTELGQPRQAAPFLERAQRLLQLSLVLDDLFYHRTQVPIMQRASVLNEGLGRIPEAFSWAVAALQIDPGTVWAQSTVQRLAPLRPDLLRRTLKETSLAEHSDLSHFPLPDWPLAASEETHITDASRAGTDSVQFADDTQKTGIDFQYFNSGDPSTPGARIFETTGGGVGVIDFDADGWPDLYLTQGCTWPLATEAKLMSDQLYRNIRGQRFAASAEQAGTVETGFSQGVSVGDIDHDGFPDVYVANLGQNRLFHNNGDGSFTDVTAFTGLDGALAELWTTSCMIADLNGDSLPDLFDVNYAAGSNIETLICEEHGTHRSCSPRAFDAAADHLWVNQGDGRFVNVSEISGLNVPEGFGLGIIAADFSGDGRLDVFVANDEVPNFYFVNQNSAGPVPVFAEQAMIAGVAVDGEGAAQGCMGIAADDADGDGLTDLFVTNFYQESNTLYSQATRGQFFDATRKAGLRDPSFAMLGFGTQFIDGELDGWPDLVLTNGHIDDLTALGEPWQMPPQYFRNIGGGQFRELPASQLGPFFSGRYLGRGLARIDWNLDGLDDFAVSHIGSPAALLTNTTAEHGHFLTIRLRGSETSRDAIGTEVEIQRGDRNIVKTLFGGDGYQASNHRQLTIGLGDQIRVGSLLVRWPDGRQQRWNDVPADQSVTVIQGREVLYKSCE